MLETVQFNPLQVQLVSSRVFNSHYTQNRSF